MKRFSLIIGILFFSLGLFAQQQYDIDFVQTKVMKVSGKTTEKVGHLTFDGNDQLTMTYSQPEGEYFNIEGDKVMINLDGKKAELDANKVKMVKLQRSTLLNCLSGNWEQAAEENNAEVVTTEEDGMKTITITNKGKVPRGGYASVILTYRMSDETLVKMVLEEAVGAINTYELSK